jgi:peptidoglycan/xylan/chitin deacetylase (PgdA/CDA1 family)
VTTHICFHGIGVCADERESGEARYWMAEDTFLRTLDALADRSDVELSFDDGNRSDLDIALPALTERGLRATFFVLAGRLDDPASLNARDLRSLVAAGMSIGNHGWTHTPWRALDDAAARRELFDARNAIQEASGTTPTEAALPLGRYDRNTVRRVRAAGYRVLYTSDRYRSRPGAWMRARYSVTEHDTAESVSALVTRRSGASEARNAAASLVKRLR